MATLRSLATELSALGRLALSMPLRPLLGGESFDRGAPHPTPVVLVHGLLGNPTNFLALRKVLFGQGIWNFASFSYAPRLDCQRLGRGLRSAIEAVCRETGAPQVDVVGHSLGGLLGRYVVEMGDEDRVRRLVTIGAPYFTPRTLPQELAIFAAQDLIIPAPDAVRGPRGRVLVVPDCGHLGLLYHPSVLDAAASFLASADDAAVTPSRPVLRVLRAAA